MHVAAVTAVTKVATGAFAAGRDGVGRRGQVRAGTALIARGEFSVVVVGLVGAAADPGLRALIAAYVLILASTGPLLTRFADGLGPRAGRRSARPSRRRAAQRSWWRWSR